MRSASVSCSRSYLRAEKPRDTGLFARDPLTGVMSQDMSDFVRQDGGQLVVVTDHSQDSSENRYLAAGQSKRVDLFGPNDVRLPLESIASYMQIYLLL